MRGGEDSGVFRRARARALQLWMAALLGGSLIPVACGRTLLDDGGDDTGMKGAAGAARVGAGGGGARGGQGGNQGNGGSGNGATGGMGMGGSALSGKACTTPADCRDQGPANDCFDGICTCHNACSQPAPSQVGRACATDADCVGAIPQQLVTCASAVCQCIESDCGPP